MLPGHMGMVGRGGLLLGLVLVSSMFAWTASSNSAGAPQNSADTGCTCHNAQPDTAVTVGVQGFPEAYAAGTTYDVTITVAGGPVPVPAVSQNQGGFAMKVSGGLLLADDGITVTGGTFATHSAETNNQRSWALQWVAPETSVGAVNV
ncbi:MAG TPA: choice-of-anchor V domain-containing protein, partial [Candidatus Thermoplasmatota archaeon]